VAAFCGERKLCAPHFFAWKKRLREAAASRQPQGGQAEQFRGSKNCVAARQPASLASDSRVEIRLPNGRSLLVGAGFDAQHLQALAGGGGERGMIGLPSLHTLDREQVARIWLAGEATDMRCALTDWRNASRW